jgi:hypothetical protein
VESNDRPEEEMEAAESIEKRRGGDDAKRARRARTPSRSRS